MLISRLQNSKIKDIQMEKIVFEGHFLIANSVGYCPLKTSFISDDFVNDIYFSNDSIESEQQTF